MEVSKSVMVNTSEVIIFLARKLLFKQPARVYDIRNVVICLCSLCFVVLIVFLDIQTMKCMSCIIVAPVVPLNASSY